MISSMIMISKDYTGRLKDLSTLVRTKLLIRLIANADDLM